MYLGNNKSDAGKKSGGEDAQKDVSQIKYIHDSDDLKTFLSSKPYAVAKGAVGGNIQTSTLLTRNLPNILKLACLLSPDKGVLHVDEKGRETLQTNAEIMADAKCVLAGLRDKGLKPGDKVVLQVDDQASFLVAFWGASLGGFVTVPLPIPGGFPASEGMERVTKVCGILDRFCIVTDLARENYASLDMDKVFSFSELKSYSPAKKIHRPRSKDTAILLFSSGSTGDPKGVILTHKNLMCEIETGSMSCSDVPAGDYRTAMMGFPMYVMRRTLFKNRGPGPFNRLVGKIVGSGFGRLLFKIRPGQYLLDTLEIVSGRIISVNLRMNWNEIIMANWMPYSHVVGLIGLHVAPTALGFTQISLKTNIFSENPALLLKLVDRYRISYLPCPNFAVQWLTTQVSEEDIQGVDLSCIKMLGNTAEPISPHVTRTFIEKFEKFGFRPEAMICAFGMSEATAEIAVPPLHEKPRYIKIDKEYLFRDKIAFPVSADEEGIELTELGPPVQCMHVRVVDDHDKVVRENMVGHVQIKGPTVVKGYFNNPAANENLFCDGWLRTGDMGFLADGRLVLTGRQKDIIFVNGQNLYANDIEHHIKKMPGLGYIDFAVVGLKDFGSDSEKIILFMNTDQSGDTLAKEALAAMLARINKALIAGMGVAVDYLVPVNELPRTPTAKIKRFKLREQFETNAYKTIITSHDAVDFTESAKARKEEPLTQTEAAIIKIWQAVTEKEHISKYDNFFDLGGNSLKATKVASRIREEFGVEIPIRTIFEYQTIKAYAAVLAKMATAPQLPVIEKLDTSDSYEISHAQKRLWFLDKLVPDPAAYNIHLDVLVNGDLDINACSQAFQVIVDRHESLRTTFSSKDGRPVQQVADHLKVDITVQKISAALENDPCIKQEIATEALKVFDLEKGPLFRINVLKLSHDKHIILFTMHHIISDGWSIGVLVGELVSAYSAITTSTQPILPELRVQYRDFCAWQNRLMETDALKSQETYWLDRLKGSLPLLELPIDNPRPPVQTNNGATYKFNLDTDLRQGIRELADKQDATLFMLMLSVFGMLLGRLSHQDDIIIGSPIAGRNHAEIEGLIGFFVNTLALRMDLSDDPDFQDLLLQVKNACLDAYANQDFPFDELVVLLHPSRDTSRTPVFNVMFVLQNAVDNIKEINVGNTLFRDITQSGDVAKFDLTLFAYEYEDHFEMHLEYNTDLFNPDTIERFAGYYRNLLQSVIDAPEKRISFYDFIGQDEKRLLLETFNPPAKAYPHDKCIQELIDASVDAYPDRIALIQGETCITYSELERKSNQVAHYLRYVGIKPDMPVGILMDRSVDLVVGVLGIIKAGGAYVPLDPEYPEARIAYMIDDSAAELILTQTSMLEKLPPDKATLLCMDLKKDREPVENMPDTRPKCVNTSRDLVYLVYTSGSTGNPKGIEIEHQGLINYITWSIDYYDIRDHGSFPLYTSMSFDLTVTSIFVPLVAGESIHIQPNNLDPAGLVANVIQSPECDVTKLTPAHLEIADRLTDGDIDIPSHLNRFILGGEALSPKICRSMFKKYPHLTFYNEYGPAETVVGCIVYKFNALDPGCTHVLIGKPIQNTTIYILDDHLNLVPVGVPGEICISSPGVARGYLNKDEVTARSFVENPFNPNERIYRTGDLGKWLGDGNIAYMGRLDHQVKIRGYRIELGEVEAVLSKYDAIHDSVVVDRCDSSGDRYLAGYYVGDGEIASGDVKSFLRQTLPDYMVPARLMQLDELPLTPNGKVDRDALPDVDGVMPDMESEYLAPRNPTEASLAHHWEALLDLDKVGVNDNFFDLGGNSLKATQVVSYIRTEFNVEMPFRTIFEHQTVGTLSSAVLSLIKSGKSRVLPPVLPLEPRDYYELSHAQKRLWLLDKIVPESPLYNIPAAVVLEDMAIDVDVLKKLFQAVVDRHETLRTSFTTIDNNPVQVIIENAEVDVHFRDISQEADQEKMLVEMVNREALKPFNLEKGPLLRINVVRLSDTCHAFLITMHHIISDGWSMGLFVQEVMGNYFAYTQGKPSPFPALEVQYKDFSAWQNQLLESEDIKEQEKYWLENLAGDLPVLNLPIDFARPSIQSQNGTTQKVRFNRELTKKLRAFARQQDVTMYMLMHACFKVLLHKLSNQDDIIVGSPIAGRTVAQIEPLIGFFVNIQPIRSDFSENPVFTDFLEQIKQTSLNAYANQDYPFDRLVEVLNPSRDMSRSAVFDVVFDFHDATANPFSNVQSAFSVKDVTSSDLPAKFDLTVTGVEEDDAITMSFNYNTDLFKENTIDRIMGYFSNILEDVVLNPEKRVSDLTLLTSAEKKKILFDFNDTDAGFPDETLHELFEEQVIKTPDNIAVKFEDKQVTYKELNQKANQLARLLRQKGVTGESIVSLMVDRSVEMIIGIFGILKAGGAYLPIDPEYPEDRIRYMLEDSGTEFLLTFTHLHEKSGFEKQTIYLDREDTYQGDDTNLDIINKPTDLAYIIYTSGTTGKPKGAMIEHVNVVRLMFNDKNLYDFHDKDVWTMFHSVCFDFSVWEMYGALLFGGKLVVIPKMVAVDPKRYLSVLKEEGVTVLNQTPSAFYNLVEEELKTSSKDLVIQYVIFGGEALKPVKLKEWKQKYPETQLINMYGITETTVHVTFKRITDKEIETNISNIGTPIPTLRTYVMDLYQNLLPIGVPGELCVAGDGVGRGYLNRPELTAEKFISNPYKPGERLYRSGDLVKFLENGEMEYLGRIDHQVKIRGFRIELGEIETQLLMHDDITEAVVLAKETSEENSYLCAYYVSEKELTVSDLREYLAIELPDYMIPSYFIPIERVPLTHNGKVDRRALPDPEGVRPEMASRYVPPSNQLETSLVEIWQDILSVDKVGIFDNFFELGGNSLRATQVVSRIREDLGFEMPVRWFFEHTTLAALAEAMTSDDMSGDMSEAVNTPIVPIPKAEHYEVSHAQKRLWYLDKVMPDSSSYNVSGAVLIENMTFDDDLLNRALMAVVQRHETLRTCLATIDNRPYQVISDHTNINLEILDLSGDKDQEEQLEKRIQQEKLTPFNLEKGPLLRAIVVRLSDSRHAFLITMHHIISDGWSIGVFIREVLGNYLAFSQGDPSPFPELEVQYKDFSHWQNQLLVSDTIKEQENYWLDNLSGELPVLNLPTDRSRPAIQTQSGGTRKIFFDKEMTRQLRRLARQQNVTMFMLMHAGFKVLLHKLSGQDDIIVGSPIAGRTASRIEPMIGFFVNMQPLRSNFSANPGFSEFLHQVRQTALGAYAHQDYPFDRLVEVLNPARDMSRSPVFDVVFDFHEAATSPYSGLNSSGISFKDITGDELSSKFDLTVAGVEENDGISMLFVYNTDLFDAATIDRMMGYYHHLLKGVCAAPDTCISELDILDDAEKHRILHTFNDTELDVPKDTCMHTLFSQKASGVPDNIAVIYKDKSMTYGALDKKANQLAHALMDYGVKSDDLVGLLIGRCDDLIVAQLGAWKAGGAFVPIDPNYPSDRIKYLIDNSQSKVLITQKALLHQVPEGVDNVICLDAVSEDIARMPETAPKVDVGPDNLAYVIYTSGSTGRPKGAQVMHRNLINLCSWHNHELKLNETDRGSLFAGVSFDASVYEIWPHLITGSSIVPLENVLNEMSPRDIVDWLKKNNITSCFIPTKLAEVMLDSGLADLNLKILHTGGDRLSFIPRKVPFHVINNYGPAEATVVTIAADVKDWDNSKGNPVIGKPVANVKIYILDKYLKPVPVGVMGELYIGGAAVGRGYLNDPEKTKSAFVPNPFSQSDDFLYKTGDFVRWLPDGNVDYIGRKDFQVEIRGYRVEIGEIEAVLAGFKQIRECVVIDKTDASGSTRLIGFHVSDESFDETACYSHLQNHLPAYMVPSRLIRLDKFPTTPNDKLDRRALTSMVDDHPASTTVYVAPRDDVEAALCEVWEKVLNVKKVGVYDNFFDLGGDSIISLQVVSRITQRGYKLHPKDILQYQTISELADVAEEVKGIDAEQGPVEGESPLTPIQKYFFKFGLDNVNHFNQAVMVKSPAKIDTDLLRSSLQAVMDHHDALRTCYAPEKQTFMPPGTAPHLVIKQVKDDKALKAEIESLQASFDIANGPVFGAGVYHMENADYLVLAAHHLVVDGVSWRILLEDLLTCYNTMMASQEIVLPQKTTSYKAWAERFDAYAAMDHIRDEAVFWEKEVSEHLASFPLDHDLGPNDVASLDTITVVLDETQTHQLLKEVHKAYNTEMNDLLLAALVRSYCTWTGRDGVVFDLEGHGRESMIEDVDISRTVGWFTAVYPVVLSGNNGSDLAAQIKYVKEKLRSIPHKGFNYGVLNHIHEMNWPLTTGMSFNYLGQLSHPVMEGVFDMITTDVPGAIDKKNLRINLIDIVCMIKDNRLRISLMYSTNKHKPESIETFAASFKDELCLLIKHCLDPESFDITPSDFDLMDFDQDTLDNLSDFE